MRATRRSVVAMLLAAAGVSIAGRRGLGANLINKFPAGQGVPTLEIQPGLMTVPQIAQPRLHTRIIRPDDFLFLDIEYENIAADGDPVTELRRADPSVPALIIVHHQAQAIADRAYQEVVVRKGDNPIKRDGSPYAGASQREKVKVPPGVTESRMAGPSQVVFVMPADVASIPYTLPSLLLAFRTWAMNLDFQAAPAPKAAMTGISVEAALNGIDAHLATIGGVLAANTSPSQQAALNLVLGGTFAAVKQQVAAAAAESRVLSGAEIDSLIETEFQHNLGRVGIGRVSPLKRFNPNLGKLGTGRVPATGLPPQEDALSTVTADGLPILVLIPKLEKPHEPAKTVTAIELPYRLIQSPLATAGWMHADLPQTHGNLTEIWHTRLGTRIDGGGVDDRAPEPLRAIWSPDYPLTAPPNPFTMSLDGFDRKMLVRLTAGYNEIAGGNIGNPLGRFPYVPEPAIAKRLMLSALGGWLLEDGEWPLGTAPIDINLTQWNHRAAMARDYYVRVVYAGYLFPLGHATSLVKVTERKFENQEDGKGRIAVLRQRFFIIVRQRTKLYPGVNQPYQGKDLPFTRVDILTTTTPDIGVPGANDDEHIADASFYNAGDAGPFRDGFWPVIGNPLPGQGPDLLFQAVGFDHAGAAIPFTTPLFFIATGKNADPSAVAMVVDEYNQRVENLARRKRAFNGTVIQFAPNTGTAPGDTNIPTQTISFKAWQPNPNPKESPGAVATVPPTDDDPLPAQFYPGTESAEVKLPSVQRLLGTDKLVTASVSDVYLQSGFDETNNAGQVFLDLVTGSMLNPGAPSDKGGGLVMPNMTPTALSRTIGTLAGADNAKALIDGALNNPLADGFHPEDFLGDLTLLGVVPLGKILVAVLPLDKAPKLVNLELPDELRTTFSLRQEQLKRFPDTDDALFIPDADAISEDPSGPSVLDITAVISVKRNGLAVEQPQSRIDGKLNNFKINLFGCIVLKFDSISFVAVPGKKPDVTIGLNADHGVVFGGPLEFVNKLKDYIPANGFTDPPALAVTPAGITASFSLALPAITVGVLTLQNVNLGAGFSLPFDGRPPSARFNFAERHNPFNLTVSLFGGGGFLAISVSAKGVQEIEATLEFGAFAALDLGVASGSVYVKGGFYFHWLEATHEISLEAFVELGGHLSVLGLISVTLTFHVGLTYHTAPGISELVGQATLTIEVEVLFFSKSVSMTVEKRFAGSAADPLFIDFIPTADVWQKYCAAFG